MTNRNFGAPAPITPPAHSQREAEGRRVVRGAWLIARLIREEPVRRKDCQERFGRPARSFCCEVAALRAAGIYRASDLVRMPDVKRRPGTVSR